MVQDVPGRENLSTTREARVGETVEKHDILL
jgi:hypothetical protein